MDSAQTRSLVSQASGTSEKTLGRKPRSGYCLRAVTCFLVFSVAGAGWVVKCMPGPEPHKGQHFINTQLPSKHSIHLLFPGFALLDNRTSVLGRDGDGSVSRNNCSSLSCGQFHALQSLRSWAIFMGGKRVFLTQVNCGLYYHLVKLLHLTSLKLRKGLVDYYEVGKTE